MAFERFRLDLRGDAYLAGPNNAGKSTLITAIRVAAQMLRIAVRRNPTETFRDGKEQVLGYSFTNLQVGLDGVGIDVYEERFWELKAVRFEYLYVGLPALDAALGSVEKRTRWRKVATSVSDFSPRLTRR